MTDPWTPTDDPTPWPDEPPPDESAQQPEPEAASPFKLTLVTRSGLANLPPVEPLIEGIMSRRSAVVLYGPTGAGKSFLALAWACCVGTGLPWLSRSVERARVLYVVGEGASGLDARITAWEQAWGQTVDDEDVIFSVKPPGLSHNGAWQGLVEEASGMNAGLVVLDTFSSLYPDADETKDAARITRELSDLATTIDGTALLVHHPGWGDPERTRGGYQLTANVDEVLQLVGTAQEPQLTLKRTKAKDDAAGDPIHLLRRVSRGSCIIEGRTPEQAVADAGGTAEAIARVTFTENETFSRAALNRAISAARGDEDAKNNKHYRAITAMISAGIIIRDGGTDRQAQYRLVPVEEPTGFEDTGPAF